MLYSYFIFPIINRSQCLGLIVFYSVGENQKLKLREKEDLGYIFRSERSSEQDFTRIRFSLAMIYSCTRI